MHLIFIEHKKVIISTKKIYSKGKEGRELKLVKLNSLPPFYSLAIKFFCGYNHFFILLFHGVGENKSFIEHNKILHFFGKLLTFIISTSSFCN